MFFHSSMDEGGTPVEGVWYKLVLTPTASWLFSFHTGAFATTICRANDSLEIMTALTVDFSRGTSTHQGAYPWNYMNRSS